MTPRGVYEPLETQIAPRVCRVQDRTLLMAIALLLLLGGRAPPMFAAPPKFLFGAAATVPAVSTPNVFEASPSLTADELEMYLRRGDDLYVARRATKLDGFGAPVKIDEVSAAKLVEGGPSISADGLTLYFHRQTQPNGDFYDVWTATRPSRDAPFGVPTDLSDAWGLSGKTRWIHTPEVSADGLSLWMGFLNGDDTNLYLATRTSVDQPWGMPAVVPDFSDPQRSQSEPGISSDGLALFFLDDANRPDGRGIGDIAVSTRASLSDPWSEPVNLGDAINTNNYLDFHPYLTNDGSTLYFCREASDDVNGETIDIYQAPLLPFTAVPLAGQGSTYQQKFDSLGDTSKTAGQTFPDGWTFTANDVVFNNATTRKFPISNQKYAGAFNAGMQGEADRALATGVTQLETGELQFRAQVAGGPVQALRLSVDVEAWQVAKSLAVTPGEAAFQVILEADTGKGFEKLADLGRATTGEKLVFPPPGSSLDGNDPANRGSFDSGPVSVSIPEGATLRLRFVPPSETDVVGWTFGLDNLSLHTAAPGDANVDGKVDLADFGTLKANFGKVGHFTDGDFSGNGQIDLSDFGLLKDNLGRTAAASVPEPATWVLLLVVVPLIPLTARRWR